MIKYFITFLVLVYSGAGFAAAEPEMLLHLDASDHNSLKLDAQNRVIQWDNTANPENSVVPKAQMPLWVPDAWNKLPVIRFSGKEELITKLPLNSDAISAFVVFRREKAQAGAPWQHLLYWDSGTRHGAATHTLSSGASGGVAEPGIYALNSKGDFKYPLLIGSNGGSGGFLTGDIAEIIVFDKNDLSAKQIDEVRNYLMKKWNIKESDYLRSGKLPETPVRISDKLPLSDQQNTGNWKLIPEYSDEFNSDQIDKSKWLNIRHYTLGIAPSRILAENTVEKDGKVSLIAKYDENMPQGRVNRRGPEYHSFTVGRLFSKYMFRYGYIECRAKALPSSFNSAFWLYGVGKSKNDGRIYRPEIDIFEISGKSFAHTYSYNTAIHCVKENPNEHIKHALAWKSDFKFTDDYHVYGLKWTPERITFYVDGAVVRDFEVKDNLWDMPMRLHFDLMPHFDWFGVPKAADFPASFDIDYVRVWKNPETEIPDDKKYELNYPAPEKGFAYDYWKKYGKSIVMTDKPKAPVAAVDVFIPEIITLGRTAANQAKSGLALYFPSSIAVNSSGDTQYAAPSPNWPLIEFNAETLAVKDWSPYDYLAIDYFNPGFIQACTLIVKTENNASQSTSMLMKKGSGTFYLKLNENIKKSPVKSLTFRIRGSDEEQTFIINRIQLEKD